MTPIALRTTARAASAALALLLAAACGADRGVNPTLFGAEDPDATLFVAETEASSGRDAEFVGRVLRDQNGCLRRESRPDLRDTEQRTLIWPAGWRLESRGEHLVVKDAAGNDVGRVGAQFRLGGGEIPQLSYAAISGADAQLLQTRCPGAYWLVAGH